MTTYKQYKYSFTDKNGWGWTINIIPNKSVMEFEYNSDLLDEVDLPSGFFLDDALTITSDLGDIPCGIVGSTAKCVINLSSINDALYDDLRESLLSINVDAWYALQQNVNVQAFETLGNWGGIESNFYFKPYNTYVFKTNYGDGDNYSVFWMGCQKPNPNNILTVTEQSNILTLEVELDNLFKCICEQINTKHLAIALRHNTKNCNGILSLGEFSEKQTGDNNWYLWHWGAPDTQAKFKSFVSLKNDLQALIGAVLRIFLHDTQATVSTFPLPFSTWGFRQNTKMGINTVINVSNNDVGYVSEIWLTNKKPQELKGGVHVDANCFNKFTNLYDILKNIAECSLETWRLSYTNTTLSVYSNAIFDGSNSNGFALTKSTAFSDVKIDFTQGRGLSSTEVNVESVKGKFNTEEFRYSDYGTDGDNTKTISTMFHNMPVNGDEDPVTDFYQNKYEYKFMPAGMIIYQQAGDVVGDYRRVRADVLIKGQTLARPDKRTNNSVTQSIYEQQQSCSPLITAQVLYNEMSNAGQLIFEFDTSIILRVNPLQPFTVNYQRPEDIGKSAVVYMNQLNPYLTGTYYPILMMSEVQLLDGSIKVKYLSRGSE